METTLEVRWFLRGMPPAVVQRWFRLECPGKMLEKTEVRKDWYACQQSDYFDLLKRFSSHVLNREEINLKLRQGNLELKLRQQNFGTYGFGHLKQSHTCTGKVEQWCKLNEQKLRDFALTIDSLGKIGWIGIEKEREQKIDRGVKSELTWLKIDGDRWWTVAFEMTQDRDRQRDSCFKEVVENACQTYYGPKLSASNSYGYSHWLLELTPQTIPEQKLDVVN